MPTAGHSCHPCFLYLLCLIRSQPIVKLVLTISKTFYQPSVTKTTLMAPKLEQVFTLRAFIAKEGTLPLGSVKGGAHRLVVPVVGGFLSGSGLEAEILPSSGDWPLLDPAAGIIHLDARLQARSSSGQMIHIRYPGIMKMDPQLEKGLQWSPEAKTTESRDHYWIGVPVFEVNSEELKWMEQTVFVAHGHWYISNDGKQAVEYEVYKVVSG